MMVSTLALQERVLGSSPAYIKFFSTFKTNSKSSAGKNPLPFLKGKTLNLQFVGFTHNVGKLHLVNRLLILKTSFVYSMALLSLFPAKLLQISRNDFHSLL